MFENIHRGEYQIGDKTIYFRSKWEANYALYLEWLKEKGQIKSWEYEPERYDFIGYEGKRPFVVGMGYLPDFRVTNNDGKFYLVELKGFRQGMLRLKRMKKYYPDIKIEIVDTKEYGILKKKIGKICKFF